MYNNFRVSPNSAFQTWKPCMKYSHLMYLIETNQIRLYNNNKLLTPFEGAIWLDSLKLECSDGLIKITSE